MWFVLIAVSCRTREDCSNGVDDDGDGLVDCADVSCVCSGGDSAGADSGTDTNDTGPVPETIVVVDDQGATVPGPSSGSLMGEAVAALGDTNGDGRADVALGAPGAGVGGAVLVFEGAAQFGVLDDSLAAARISTSLVDASAGIALAGGGDSNGDAVADLWIGGHLANGEAGAAWLIHGPFDGEIDLGDAAAVIDADDDIDWAGRALAWAGAVDGGANEAVWVGVAKDDSSDVSAGAAYLLAGPQVGALDLQSFRARWSGEAGNDWAARELGSGRDVDGDGIDDLVVGAPKANAEAGRVYLVSGAETGQNSLSDALLSLSGGAGDNLGDAVALVPDLDGDGLDDLAAGGPGHSGAGENAGVVAVVASASGSLTLSDADALLVGAEPDDRAGASVTGAGDLDGDGLGDLLVGARTSDLGGPNGGAVFVVHGPVVGSVDLGASSRAFVPKTGGDRLGTSVAVLGDYDGDGGIDLALGAPESDAGGDLSGAVHLVLGQEW